MAGWQGETTIISIPHTPRTPHPQRESGDFQRTPAQRAFASGLRPKARTVLRQPSALEMRATQRRQRSGGACQRGQFLGCSTLGSAILLPLLIKAFVEVRPCSHSQSPGDSLKRHCRLSAAPRRVGAIHTQGRPPVLDHSCAPPRPRRPRMVFYRLRQPNR